MKGVCPSRCQVLAKVGEMFTKFLNVLFGCRHNNYSFPMTIKPRVRCPGASHIGTYVVCLDCGKEMSYDWALMRIAKMRVASSASPGSSLGPSTLSPVSSRAN